MSDKGAVIEGVMVKGLVGLQSMFQRAGWTVSKVFNLWGIRCIKDGEFLFACDSIPHNFRSSPRQKDTRLLDLRTVYVN